MKKYSTTFLVAILVFGALLINKNLQKPETKISNTGGEIEQTKETLRSFSHIGLSTNTNIFTIPLDEVLDGGPRKDGIPALSNVQFTSAEEAKNIPEESLGILIQKNEEVKYYPYTILVWHEIVNDVIENTPVAVTFCPLCGSAIVFEREQDDVIHEFGVSGKLWQSNLLMYDKATESLWSQIEGKAVIGDLTHKELDIYPSQLMSFNEAKQSYPNLKVLSEETGYSRDYGFYPYGDYEEHEGLIFPINHPNEALPAKTLMYASIINNEAVAFHRENLLEQKHAQLETQTGVITATVSPNNEITLSDEKGTRYPGYISMWFSWANHNTGPVWQ